MPLSTAHSLSASLASGATTSVAVVGEYLKHIESRDKEFKAFITVRGEEAMAEAVRSDARRAAGDPLSDIDGIPIAIKDNICTNGTRTTCASKMLGNFVPPYDATVIEKLKAAGAIVIGKSNLDEFAMGSSTEHSFFGASRNPWDTGCVPGGSSGGSAVAVAGGLAPWALGSDTGGSIRQPAGFCGIVGLKPTYGRVSRYGLVAFASSLDQIGPMTLDVEDAALLMDVIGGHDPKDSTSSPRPLESMRSGLREGSLKGLRVARPKEFFEVKGMDPGIEAVCNNALSQIEKAGATIVDVSMPHAEQYSVSTYYVLATAEASSNLARYDGAQYGHRTPGTQDIIEMFSRSRAEGFGAEVRRRIMLGTFVLSAETFDAYYLRASRARTLIQQDYLKALAVADVIAAPTSPIPPFRFGEKMNDPVAMYLADIFTLSLNLAGYCGIAIPAGFDPKGMPVGLQLFGGAFEEKKLLNAAWHAEQLLGASNSRMPANVA